MATSGFNRSFRFADESLQNKLIELVRTSGASHAVDKDGNLQYSLDDEEFIGNDLICSIRDELFQEWAIFTLEGDDVSRPDETERYRRYMIDHGIEHLEERHDGLIWFLVSGDQDSHEWVVPSN